MSWFVVDVEADGPIPHKYSMVSFGAIRVDEQLTTTFYGKTKPISDLWVPEALAVSGHTRQEHEEFDDPKEVMSNFRDWVNSTSRNGRPIFVSDNNAFDFAWINFYFHYYLGSNPFGFSSRRIGDIVCGLERDLRFNWKKFRKTSHDHNPVNDAKGNAEALLHFAKTHGVGLKEFGVSSV